MSMKGIAVMRRRRAIQEQVNREAIRPRKLPRGMSAFWRFIHRWI